MDVDRRSPASTVPALWGGFRLACTAPSGPAIAACEASYGIPEADLTPWRARSLPALRREFNAVKHTDPRFAAWWQ
ncbi:hypothetical protein, partial [Streptomyces sp. NPDC050564]|uniref:hypothetical protein n=1 Tax=Streptomyces sp. NPDC050564 TaxID=3365631 RepID=UPI0037BCA358